MCNTFEASPPPRYPGTLTPWGGGRHAVGIFPSSSSRQVTSISGCGRSENVWPERKPAENNTSADVSASVVVFTLCSAALLLGTGFLGTWLSLRDSRCLQGLFVYLLVVIFCLGSTASALAYVQSRKLDTETASLGEVFQNYSGSSRDINSRAVDATQEELQCCGVSNYTDWLGASWLNQTGENLVPRSCCNTTFPSCDGNVDEPWKLYHQGCQGKLEMTFQFILRFIMWGSLLGFLTEVVLLSTMAQVMMMMERQPFRYQVLENS